jgi:hypothetical protein
MMSRGYTRSAGNLRQEVAEIVLSRPSDGFPPALFCWLCKNLIIYLEWKVFLRFQGLEGLRSQSHYWHYKIVRRECSQLAWASTWPQLGR